VGSWSEKVERPPQLVHELQTIVHPLRHCSLSLRRISSTSGSLSGRDGVLHGHIFEMNGESYRFRELLKARRAAKPKEMTPPRRGKPAALF
jgi:hypothetical protein